MPLRIINLRPLTSDERYFLTLAEEIDLHPDDASRREALLWIGGGALAAFMNLGSTKVHASEFSTKDLVKAIIDGGIKLSQGLFYRGDPVNANYTLVNPTQRQQRKPIYNAIESPSLGITDQDYTYVEVPAGDVALVEHYGFHAVEPGQNRYLAKTSIDAAQQKFLVQR
jgi:hypothetical protein